jgi:hypothetical protein
MEKKVLQDIHVPNGLQNDRPTRKWDYGGGDVGITKKDDVIESTEISSQEETYTTTYHNDGGGRKKGGVLGLSLKWWLFIALVAGLIVFVLVWSLFSSAVVRVVLSQQTTSINDTFKAVRVGDADGDVTYQIVKLQETAAADVQPTGEDTVVEKASGDIVVYNEHGEKMTLIVNTRFQSPDGKIYRVDRAITVPGATKDASGNIIPGSIEVTVYADEPGEAYNIGLVDFTVPGLLGTELYDRVYARSKTEMTGGFNGVLKFASEDDVERAATQLQQQVREKLMTSIGSAIEDERVLYQDAIFMTFKTNVPTDVSANGMLAVEEVGTLQAFVFDRKELSSAIANKTLSSYDQSPVLVQNLDELNFVFEDKDSFDVNINEQYVFTLSGDPHIVWEIDAMSLRNDLAGLSEDDIQSIMGGYSKSIRKIEADIKPFWRSSFPDNPDAIEIEEVLE